MIHSHKHLNPGEACATCLIDERENGMDNSKKWLIGAGALVVVGGALGYYLHNKKKKEEVSSPSNTSSEVKPQIQYNAAIEDERLGLAVAEAFAGVLQALSLLGIAGKGGKAFKFGQTTIYQYTNEGVVADLADQDALGPFDSLYFSPVQVSVPKMGRLGLATDIISKEAGASLSGLILKPALALDQAENRKLIAECVGLPTTTSFYGFLSGSAYLDATIKILMKVLVRANIYWQKRAEAGKAQNPGLVNVQGSLNPIDVQRICAAFLWAVVQNGQDIGIALGRIVDNLGITGNDKEYLFKDVSARSGLRAGPGWLRCLNYINAFSDGIFNCENPGTDSLNVASSSVEAAAQTGSVESGIASNSLKQASIVGGVVFYQK